MLMRPNTYFTSQPAGRSRDIDPAIRLTVRERVIETGTWTIAVPAIATLSIADERQAAHRWTLWPLAAVIALAGAANYAMPLLPALPVLAACVISAVALALAGIRFRRSFVLAFTTNDGSRCCVSAPDRNQLEDIRAFLTEKINRQDCRACHVFDLNASPAALPPDTSHDALHTNDALRAIAERTGPAMAPAEDFPIALVPVTEPDPPVRAREIDYSSVLVQITDLHRYYERHPQAVHIRERLSELELLMRSGTASVQHQARVRELALDLSNIMSAYPHMTHLFGQVVQLAGH